MNFVKHTFNRQKFKKHFHTNYSIGFITNGAHKLELGSKRVLAKSQEIKVINPYEAHYALEESSWQYINFMPPKSVINSIIKDIYYKESNQNIQFQNKIVDLKANRYFVNLYSSKPNTLQYEENLQIFISYLLNYSSQKFKSINIDYSINKSIDYIHEYFLQDISLDELSNISNVSKYHFIKLFKKRTALTPHQYILNLRVEYGYSLILKNYPLAQVASICNFSDQSHFIRVFKQRYGFTPSELLKST